MAQRRVKVQLSDVKKDKSDNILECGLYDDTNLYHWRSVIVGPDNTPYAGGIFHLDIQIPNGYPYTPPIIKFITKVYHPNISQNGLINLDIFADQWSPQLTIYAALLSICSFLDDPNPECSENIQIAQLYKNDKVKYNAKVKQWIQKYAK